MSLRAFSAISPGLICCIGAIGKLKKPYCHHLAGRDEDVILGEAWSLHSSDFEVIGRSLMEKFFAACIPIRVPSHEARTGHQQVASTKNRLRYLL